MRVFVWNNFCWRRTKRHGVLYIVACKSGSVLPTVGLSIVLIVVAQHMLNITLVVRSPFIATDLSRSSPSPGTVVRINSTDYRRPVDDLQRSTFAQLLSVLRRRVLEYFNPGAAPASIKPPKPLCPLPVPVFRRSERQRRGRDPVGRGDGDVDETPLIGGSWRPDNCTSRHRIAIVIPYRDRQHHLRTFLRHMHPFLQRQLLDYTIYVVEQTYASRFNRGMLLNVGFTEASRRRDHECYFFHDVDLLPENDNNIYSCPDQPRHASAAINTMSYKLPYRNLFGGVEAFRKEHFQLVNGFSNKYFGWGGEDDDLSQRVLLRRLNLTRYSLNVARYRMLSHSKNAANPQRGVLLAMGPERMENDGLNSLRYEVKTFEKRPLYTRILVDINEHTVLNSAAPTKDA